MKLRTQKKFLTLSLTAALGANVVMVNAEEASVTANNKTVVSKEKSKKTSLIEVIQVTAQKRSQASQAVGVAVTAFSGDQIDKLGFTDSTDVVDMSPGVQIYGTTGDSAFSFAVRGVAQTDFADHQESPNAVYIDEVYKSQTSTVGFSMFDTQRVEILRGPQGTVFGRNATGGLVHFITKKPTDTTEGYVKAEIGSYDTYRIEGGVGGELSENILGRISGVYNDKGPYIENRLGKDGGDSEKVAVRGQLLFFLGDSADLLISSTYGDMTVDTPQYYQTVGSRFNSDFLGVANGSTDYLGYQDTDNDPFAGDWDATGDWGTTAKSLTATLNVDFESVSLTSITDFSNVEKTFTGDTDSGAASLRPLNGTVFLPDGSFVPGQAQFGNEADVDQFSQELRLSGDFDDGLWMVGAYYLDIEGDYNAAVGWSFAGPDAGFLIGPNSDFINKTKSMAIFGQTEYELSDEYTLITGVRVTQDDLDISYGNNIIITIPPTYTASGPRTVIAPNGAFSDSMEDTLVTAKVELDWKPTDELFTYASWNLGAKGGGFNAAVSGAPVPKFDPEELNAYELGFKYTEDWGRINGAVFYYDYKDAQIFQLIGGLDQIVFNADETIKGVELETAFNLIEGLDVLLSASYIDANLEDVVAGALVTDRRPPGVPELSGSALIRYAFPVFDGELALQAELTAQSDSFLSVDNAPVMRNPGYGKTNIRVSYTNSDDTWVVTASLENVFDKEYKSQGFDLTGLTGSSSFIYGSPQWFSLTAQYNWE